MILLYVVLANISPAPENDILHDVERSVEIFKTMEVVTVARRCAAITEEVSVYERQLSRERDARQEHSLAADSTRERLAAPAAGNSSNYFGRDFDEELATFDIPLDDIFASLINSNLMDEFLDLANTPFGPGGTAYQGDDVFPPS
ncbi:hypothetical protein LTR29_017411 [Friedmanniomyces endolithicus]|nr:hypothetical protein LTR29_017411 [Friedmanniomyces endolithicus]